LCLEVGRWWIFLEQRYSAVAEGEISDMHNQTERFL